MRRNLDAQLLGYECQRCLAIAGEVDVLLAAGDAAGNAHALAVGLEVVEVGRCLGCQDNKVKVRHDVQMAAVSVRCGL